MAYSYPIWNVVQACIYGSSKSWGARDVCEVNVKVGSSSTYSNQFVNHRTTKKEIQKDLIEFRFYVDQIILKRGLFDKKNKTFNFIGTIPASINNYNSKQLELFK
tara:strand:- start:367 stop:681 length:315 start_codon:yes stop_codon:yes gene_type:complete